MLIMPKTFHETGEPFPSTGFYSSFCDNALVSLNAGGTFPPCPICHLAASWRPANLQTPSGTTAK